MVGSFAPRLLTVACATLQPLSRTFWVFGLDSLGRFAITAVGHKVTKRFDQELVGQCNVSMD